MNTLLEETPLARVVVMVKDELPNPSDVVIIRLPEDAEPIVLFNETIDAIRDVG